MTDQQAPLRIIVADDQASVREGLVLLLDLLPDIVLARRAPPRRDRAGCPGPLKRT